MARAQDIIYRASFSPGAVKRLTAENFSLGPKDLLALNTNDCTLCLFYGDNTESLQLARVWASAAQQVAGPTFAAVNLVNEKRVAEAFAKVQSDGTHDLHWAGLRTIPFILVYRQGWPVAFYNGARETQAISDYALTLACNADYFEPINIGGGLQADKRLEIGSYRVYENIPGDPPVIRTESAQYTADDSLRGYDPSIGATPPAAAQTSSQAPGQPVRGNTGTAQGGAAQGGAAQGGAAQGGAAQGGATQGGASSRTPPQTPPARTPPARTPPQTTRGRTTPPTPTQTPAPSPPSPQTPPQTSARPTAPAAIPVPARGRIQ